MTADGSMKHDIKFLKEKVLNWSKLTREACQSDRDKKLSFHSILLSSIKYYSPSITGSIRDIRSITKPAIPLILNASGLQGNLDRKLTHALLYYGGVNVFDLHSFSTADSGKWLLHGLFNPGQTTTKLFWITLGNHQIETGAASDIFKLNSKYW